MKDYKALCELINQETRRQLIEKDLGTMDDSQFRFHPAGSGCRYELQRLTKDKPENPLVIGFADETLDLLGDVINQHMHKIQEWAYIRLREEHDKAILAAASDIEDLRFQLERAKPPIPYDELPRTADPAMAEGESTLTPEEFENHVNAAKQVLNKKLAIRSVDIDSITPLGSANNHPVTQPEYWEKLAYDLCEDAKHDI